MNVIYFLKYHPEAKADFKIAKNTYKIISDELSQKFTNAVKNELKKIEKNPTFYGVRYENIRIAHPVKFPYNIHFYIEEFTVIVTAIIHNKRKVDIAIARKFS